MKKNRKKGDEVWVAYKYSDATREATRGVVTEGRDRRGEVTVLLPSLFGGGGFSIRCHADHNTFDTKEEADSFFRSSGKREDK